MANVLNTILALDTTKFQLELVKMQKKMQAFSKQMQDVGTTLTQNVTLPLAGVGAASLSAFANLEKLEKGLSAVMGGSEAAAAELDKLRESAKAPGLGFEEAVRGSIRLQAVGLSADQARGTLEAFGAAIAATGGTAQNLDSVQYQLTQMISKNRILQEDFGILQENVPLLGKAVQAAFGTANIEQIRATGISATDFNTRLVEALRTLPEVQAATGGLGNAFENFKDDLNLSLAIFGDAINETFQLEKVFNSISGAVQALVDKFKELNPSTQKTIVLLLGFAATIGPILFIIGKLSGAWAVMLTGFSTGIKVLKSIRTAFLALTSSVFAIPAAIVGAIVVIGALYNKFENVRKVVNAVGQGFIALARLAKESFSNIVQGIQQLKEGEFKAAASSFGNALGALNPIELGKTFASGFAVGFQDSKNYLKPTIEGIKKEVDQATKSFTGGGTATGTSTGTVTGEGGGTAAAPKVVDDTALREQEIALSNLSARLIGFAQSAKGPFGLIRAELQGVTGFTPKIEEQKDALLAYYKSIEDIGTLAGITGENAVEAQLKATQSALEGSIVTYGAASQAVAVLSAEYAKYKELVANTEKEAKAKKELEDQVTFMEAMGNAAKVAGEAFARTAADGEVSFKKLGRAALDAARQVVAAYIKEAVAGVVKNVLAGPLGKLGPLALGIAAATGGAAAALFSGLINKIAPPKLAQGGLAYAPTLAVVGDNRGASVDPEVIAPLSKLKDMLGGGGGFVAEARISGNDLLILVNNAERRNGRIR